MRRFLILAGLAAAAVMVASAPAEARSRVSFGFHFGFPFYPAYYAPYPYYYYPRPVVYAAPPVVYSAPPPAYVAPAPAYGYGAQPSGAVIREGRDAAGNLCREYQTTTMIDGRPTPTVGTACQRPDGQWQMVN